MAERRPPKLGSMVWAKEVIALQSQPLPVVYFDHAPGLSHSNGIIGITLTVSGNVPNENGGVDSVASVVAHLKCNIPAAKTLRDAIDRALLLATPVDNPEGKAN